MKQVRSLNGYRLIYEPEHPSAMTGGNEGYVYEHVYVMELYLGRKLQDGEVIHHLDCNRQNNRLSNLLLLSRAMHAKLHAWIDGGSYIHDSYKKDGFATLEREDIKLCIVCEKTLQEKQYKYCSVQCRTIAKRNPNKPTKEQLSEDIQEMTWLDIGRKYNVSDNGARKWARSYGLIK